MFALKKHQFLNLLGKFDKIEPARVVKSIQKLKLPYIHLSSDIEDYTILIAWETR